MKEIFTLSSNGKKEYCCSVVRVGELLPIEGSDFLAKTVVDGYTIVVRKDEVKTGDCMIYAMNETALNRDFLSANNLFELSERDLNSNALYVNSLIEDGNIEEAKKNVGFFNKHGRVRMIKLRGCPSMGFLFTLDSLMEWKPEAGNINLEDYVGIDFDTVCGELFVKAYVPPVSPANRSNAHKSRKHACREHKFDRLIPSSFRLHYDTNPINKNAHLLNPNRSVTISVKIHGTSIVIGKVLCKRKLTFIEKVKKFFGFSVHDSEYGNMYSSRNVVKNRYLKKGKSDSDLCGSDIWGIVNDAVRDIVCEGMTIYGEIAGYIPETSTPIQKLSKPYDYGCNEGEWKLFIYRINRYGMEFSMNEIKDFVDEAIRYDESLIGKLYCVPILYHGLLKDLYPNIPTDDEDWCSKALEAMKNDTDVLGMELDEPLCKNHVPREGVVFRLDEERTEDAYKLKCVKFLQKESSAIDLGEVDMEMSNSYSC